jgi:ubiquinone/menaquinone biosynthesis C-methylase UbiE
MNKVSVNAQYNVAAPESLPLKIAAAMRRRMFNRFLEISGVAPEDTLLDVGVTSDTTYECSNYLEAWYPHKDKITAVGVDDAAFLETLYPGLTYRRADGRALPFADGSFDVVHSSAVLEHVGSREEQARFISEMARVARKAAFITTPNRWFPVEFHTILPLVHWLPAGAFRTILRVLGHDELAREENLNLLGWGDIVTMCCNLGLADFRVTSVALAGWPSNLLLLIRK